MISLALSACKPSPKPSAAGKNTAPAMRAAPPTPTAQPTIALPYSVSVPRNVPQRMTFHPKGGTPYKADAHEMYRASHKAGWNACMRTFLRGKLTPTSMAPYMTQFGLQQRADQSGFKQCRDGIYALIRRHGRAAVKAALLEQHRRLLK